MPYLCSLQQQTWEISTNSPFQGVLQGGSQNLRDGKIKFEKDVGWALGQRYIGEKTPSQNGVVWNTDGHEYQEGLWAGNVSCMLHPLLFILLFSEELSVDIWRLCC